jgi:uncharacterized membrane protein YbhN (UPF0104 family)
VLVRDRLNLVGIAVSIVCIGGLVWWASRQPAPELPDSPSRIAALVLAVALYAANTLIRGERWHRLLLQDGAAPQRWDSYAITVIGYTGNNLLPARAGDAVRVVLMAPRARTTHRTVIGTLVAERVLDVVMVVALFVVVGYGVLGTVGGGDIEVIALATLGLVAAAAVAVHVARRSPRIRDFVRPMIASTLRLRGSHGGSMLAMTAAIWLVETFVWMSVGLAVGIDMSLLQGLYLVALASVFSLIPSGPAYAGTQDSAAAIGIRAVAGQSAPALAFLLVLRFVLVVPITVSGLLLLAARYGGISRLRRARQDAAADAPTPT